MIEKIFLTLTALIIFYGTMWLAFIFLPKWVDVIIGFPLAIFLMILFMVKSPKYIK